MEAITIGAFATILLAFAAFAALSFFRLRNGHAPRPVDHKLLEATLNAAEQIIKRLETQAHVLQVERDQCYERLYDLPTTKIKLPINAIRDGIDKLDAADLRSICFDMGIVYDNLRGDTLEEKGLSLIEHAIAHLLISDLARLMKERNPSIDGL